MFTGILLNVNWMAITYLAKRHANLFVERGCHFHYHHFVRTSLIISCEKYAAKVLRLTLYSPFIIAGRQQPPWHHSLSRSFERNTYKIPRANKGPKDTQRRDRQEGRALVCKLGKWQV